MKQRVTELKLIQFKDKMTKKLEAIDCRDFFCCLFFFNLTKERHLRKPEKAK